MRYFPMAFANVIVLALILLVPKSADAYSEFEAAIEEVSGRTINCAYCHEHADGPDGVKPGQIGSLTPSERKMLNKARTSFEPGGQVDSPILNDFGDHLINVIGKKAIVKLKDRPLDLPVLLGDSDLDHDGIVDGDEFLDGTHPLIHEHGNPWRLLVINLKREWFSLMMLLLATVFGIFGIEHMLHWFGHEAERAVSGKEKKSSD